MLVLTNNTKFSKNQISLDITYVENLAMSIL